MAPLRIPLGCCSSDGAVAYVYVYVEGLSFVFVDLWVQGFLSVVSSGLCLDWTIALLLLNMYSSNFSHT